MSVTAVPLQPTPRRFVVMLWAGIIAAVAIAASLAFAAPTNAVSAFLAENARAEGVVETASGLQYKVLTKGTGAAPTDEDVALVNYDGTLTDGNRFDKSQQPTPFPLGEQAAIPGFEEALKLMPKGAKYRFWIKPDLAYGAAERRDGAGNVVIPANSVLVFDIEMIDFLSKAVIRQMQMQQQMMGGMGAPPPGAH
ncbi:FKBP-type peptidyl-prolyl cis-trans isomerase [Hephaestia sp. GCM10023244]|uniref:FKBP-type peptidyl-prolyl cis-trans isomerase n=1 Tax=unclassified Hephaestia TaxID=2631281 RepID=UPI002076F53A|nr:FKBP-type peptidyl-prolyl cis-trans isomerase [Hephaestia sp. MAHUQ-44]MCM8732089.1 FKBP-type peptidyl-prolyl cis-trans isomerase [Hephaestia sp. MAHUQ-44]